MAFVVWLKGENDSYELTNGWISIPNHLRRLIPRIGKECGAHSKVKSREIDTRKGLRPRPKRRFQYIALKDAVGDRSNPVEANNWPHQR